MMTSLVICLSRDFLSGSAYACINYTSWNVRTTQQTSTAFTPSGVSATTYCCCIIYCIPSNDQCMRLIKKIKNRIIIEMRWLKMALWAKLIYYHRKAQGHMIPGLSVDFCDLAVIAFNDDRLIDYQIRTLRKHFVYPFRYTVFDNSTDKTISAEIKKVCEHHDIGYVRLPRQEFLPSGMGSYSHGIACNYAYRKYIQHGRSKFFGLLATISSPLRISI